MRMSSAYLTALFTISAMALTARVNARPALIPAPQSFKRIPDKTFDLKPGTRIVIESDSLRPIADMLANYLRPATGFELAVERGAARTNSIHLRLDRGMDGLGSEGYRLEADGDGVAISAPKEAGLFYGIQSLRQLLPAEIFSDKPVADTVWSVPAVRIEDRPRFGWRAFMLDEGRYFKGKDTVKLLLDQMAALKMNVFHWHLTDDQGWRIEIKKYPRLTEIGSKRADTQIGGWNSPKRSG
jgi:hexosaminidase